MKNEQDSISKEIKDINKTVKKIDRKQDDNAKTSTMQWILGIILAIGIPIVGLLISNEDNAKNISTQTSQNNINNQTVPVQSVSATTQITSVVKPPTQNIITSENESEQDNILLPVIIEPELSLNIDLSAIIFTDSGMHVGRNVSWEFGDGVLHIYGEGAMYSNFVSNPVFYDKRYQVHTVIISDGVTNIGEKTFNDFNILEHIEIPPSVEAIDSNAFRNCTSLKSIFIPETVIKIGAGAFDECIFLEEVFLSEGNTQICSRAFNNCTSLEKIIIPKSIGVIEYSAFNGCSNLKEVYILSKVISIGESFNKTSPDLTIYCFNNSTAEKYAISNKINVKYFINS